MTVDEYVQIRTQELLDFQHYWIENTVMNQEIFPEELDNESEWLIQETAYMN